MSRRAVQSEYNDKVIFDFLVRIFPVAFFRHDFPVSEKPVNIFPVKIPRPFEGLS